MKSVLIAATLLASTALAIPAANALQIGLGADLGVAVTIGGDDDTGINLGVGANANANAGAGAAATTITTVTLRTDATATTTADVAVDALVNATVWTQDNIEIGTVVSVVADADGTAVLIVDTTDGWIEGVDQIALRTSAVFQTSAGITVQSDEADLKAQITAAVAANAAAGAVVR